MRAGLALLLLAFLAAPLPADEPGRVRTETQMDEIRTAQAKVYLYSLNPQPLPSDAQGQAEAFHGYSILGRAEIIANDEKQGLTKALAAAVRPSDSPVARCFNPRHGLRVVSASGTMDLVICYECGQVEVYANGGHMSSFLIGCGPDVFDRALQAHGLPKAAPATP